MAVDKDKAAPFVTLLAKLKSTAAELARDDERGIEGFSLQFRNLDLEDRKKFSLQLCQAAVSRPECNRYIETHAFVAPVLGW